MEIFKLFGSIFVDTTEADEKIEKTGKKSEGLGTKLGNVAKTAGKWALGLGAAAVTAATAIGGMAINTAKDVDSAIDSYIAATGTATEATGQYEEVLKNIYKNNYGEDFQDIADSMAQVKTQLGEIEDTQLQSVTEDALALRDTFGFEVNESVRAAKMLMDQFGISSEEAYNLIAQGAQQGLDKNGDLLDSINEYSVHFKQNGLSATDMFNTFKQGADSGAFSIDKVGDAIKEMGIRMKDGSATDSLKAMKLNADDIAQAFGEGGERASWAFGEVVEGLKNIEDPIEQNTAGVAIFGTMWEDLGKDAVFAMTEYGDKFDETVNTMDKLKEVKYDNLTDLFEGLKRNVEMLLLPLGNALMPVLKQIISDNMPMIQEMIEQVSPIISEMFAQLLPPLMELVQSIMPVFIDIIQQLLPFVTQIVQAILPVIVQLIQMLLPPIMQIVQSVLPILIQLIQPLLDLLQPIINLLQPIINLFMTLLEPLLSLINMILPPLIQLFTNIIQLILPPLQAGLELVANVIATVFKGAFDLVSKIIQNTISVFEGIINFVKVIFVGAWQGAFNQVKYIFSSVFETIKNVIGNVKNVFSNIINFVKNVFTGNWSAAWQNIKNIFSNIISGLANIFKTPINWIINGINTFIRGINKIKIPDWVPGVGGKGFHINEIPKLKVGIDYVPEDDYPALLHKGERVLTKEENAEYMKNRTRKQKELQEEKIENNDNSSSIIFNITNFYNNRKQDIQALSEEMAFYASSKRKAKGATT